MIKAWFKRIVLWVGLLLCLYALWRAHALVGDAAQGISLAGWTLVGALLVLAWGLAIVAWRQYLLAYTEEDPGWTTSMRQVGLLLVGKYLPGGVFGFLARLYDSPSELRTRLVWAGLAEQVVSVGMLVTVGGVLYLAAIRSEATWLCMAIAIPVLGAAGVRLMHRSASSVRLLRERFGASQSPAWPDLLLANTSQLVQLLTWAGLVVLLANELYDLDVFAASGLAGAFMLAVAAGMLVIFVPGGIGVREGVLIGLTSPWLDMGQAIFLAALLRIISSVLDVLAGAAAAMINHPETRND